MSDGPEARHSSSPPPGDPERPRSRWARVAPVAAFAACSLIWGSTFLVIRVGNDALPPLWAAALRLMVAALILLALVRGTGRTLPRGAALRAAALFGLLNAGLGFCLLYWGETRVASGITAIVFGTIPFTTAIAARAFGLERLTAAKLLSTLLAVVGIAVLFRGELDRQVSPSGLLAILVSTVCASLSGVALKRGPRQHALGANAVAASVGCGVCLLGSVLMREAHPLPLQPAAWGPVLYLTLAGSVGAFSLYAWLVNQWPLTRISFVAVIVPLIATALGALVRHERLTPGSAVGAAIVLAAQMLSVRVERSSGR